MEGTCAQCVFPLTEEERKSKLICPTDTSLVYAAAAGKLSCVKELIAAGADVNAACECHGDGALISATMAANSECLKELITAGADVNLKNNNGRTAVSFAANCQILIELINAGADVNSKDNKGKTALMYAVTNGNVENVKAMLCAGADVNASNKDNMNSLMITAREGNIKCLRELLAAGAKVNKQDEEGRTALIISVIHGHVYCVKELLIAGADQKYSTKDLGQTALMISGLHGNTECMKQLISAGAKVNRLDKSGRSALLCAAEKGQVDCVKELIAAGAKVNYQDILGQTALMLAAWKGDIHCVKELLNARADIDRNTEDKDLTALMVAALYGHDGCLKELISAEPQKASRIRTENFLRKFLEAGGTPDFAHNSEDADVLKGAFEHFGWSSPLKLFTLCKMKSKTDMLVDFPTSHSMTIVKKGRRYLATVTKGAASKLKGEMSDVELQIKEGCPKGAYLMEVRTDLSNFGYIIPDDECFISPIVEVLAPAKTCASSYTARIPHCLDEDDDRTKVKVRMIHENRNPAVVEVPIRSKSTDEALFYDIDSSFIELHCSQFCHIVCTICQTPYHCTGRICGLWLARYDTQQQSMTLTQSLTRVFTSIFQENESLFYHDVEIRPYFCGSLHTMNDFKKNIEGNTNLKYVTQGSVKTSMENYNPESGQITITLEVRDPRWQPRVGHHHWDISSRAFTEEKDLLDVINLVCGHRCRVDEPVEATIYALEAMGDDLQKFMGIGKVELALEVEPSTLQHKEKKKRIFSMDLPIDFSMNKHKQSISEALSQSELRHELKNDTERRSERQMDYAPEKKIQKKNLLMMRERHIESMLRAAGFEELPSEVHNRELAKMASLFSPSTLETLAIQQFGTSQARVSSLKMENNLSVEAFKRSLLQEWINRSRCTRKDLYRILLEAESEGILDDVDMLEVERLILDPERDKKLGSKDEVHLRHK